MNSKKILTILLIALTLFLNAQERCGTTAITEKMISDCPKYAKARAKVNSQTAQWIKEHPNHNKKTIITIPVVVHVVWKTNTHNISDAQIQSQIDALNKDYRRTNIDTIRFLINGRILIAFLLFSLEFHHLHIPIVH